ncbi:MAG: amidohydrolase family protein [Sphingomonadales bacterium]
MKSIFTVSFKSLMVAIGAFGLLQACEAQTPSNAKTQVDLIVEGEHLLTMEGDAGVIRDGAVAVKDGVIVALGARADILEGYAANDVISGEDRVLMPGLINGHTHAAMVLFRGLADDLDLMTWLTNYIFPMEGQFVDEAFVETGARLACYEMIRGGTTTFVDMYFYPDTSAKVFEECGLRAVLGAPMIDFPSPGFKGWDDSFAEGVAFAKRWKGKDERITPALAPHAPYTVAPEHLKSVLNAAKELGVGITMHLAEDRSETTQILERYGKEPIPHVAELGMLDYPLIAAHVVQLKPEHMELLAKGPVGAIHNPTSNLKTGAGISPVPDLLAAGVKVGLGTDGAASNNDLDMWEEIRLAALLHKGVRHDPTVMPAPVALSLATNSGAKAIGMGDKIGALKVGMKADMIQVELSSPELAPLYDVVSHLVYAVKSDDVMTTIVSGKVLMRDGEVLTVDGDKARADALAKGAKIKAALSQN